MPAQRIPAKPLLVPWVSVLYRHWGSLSEIKRRLGLTGQQMNLAMTLNDPNDNETLARKLSQASGFDSRRWTKAFRDEAAALAVSRANRPRRIDSKPRYVQERIARERLRRGRYPPPTPEAVVQLRADALVKPKRWR